MSNTTNKSTPAKSQSSSRSEPTHASRQDLYDQAHVVKEDIGQLATTAGDVAVAELEPIKAYIAKYPVKSMLIAAGVGALLGMYWKR